MVVPVAGETTESLIAFVDVLHEFASLGCCAGLLVVNQYSEPVEFVFNRVPDGCERRPFRALWPQQSAARSEARALLQSLFRACRSDPAAVIAPEEHVDVRLLALELRVTIPLAVLRADSPEVLRWVPAQPLDDVKGAVEGLRQVAALAEPVERVAKGLLEAYGSPSP